jgi:hypothetical protein
VADGGGLENRYRETYREFESLALRSGGDGRRGDFDYSVRVMNSVTIRIRTGITFPSRR